MQQYQVDEKLVITGGFPCQDVSVANPNCFGLDGDRSSLWKEMLDVIGYLRPDYAIVENVPGLKRWLGEILGDLAGIGFDAQWHSIPASAVGAPHQRERLWIVAYPTGKSGLQAHSLTVSIRKNIDAWRSIGGLHWREMASPDWTIPDRWLTISDDGVSRKLVCRAYGNAIVWQVAAAIMQAIKETEDNP